MVPCENTLPGTNQLKLIQSHLIFNAGWKHMKYYTLSIQERNYKICYMTWPFDFQTIKVNDFIST